MDLIRIFSGVLQRRVHGYIFTQHFQLEYNDQLSLPWNVLLIRTIPLVTWNIRMVSY